jgi:hypothetical protein
VIHGNDLAVATHGRAFWILDDISPLRQLDESLVNSNSHLFVPGGAIRSRMGHVRRRRDAIGENPPNGAILYYYLKEEPKEPIRLEVLDAAGKVIRSYSSVEKKEDAHSDEWDRDEAEEYIPAKAGLNVFAWDLRYQEPVKIPKAVYDSGEPIGPLVLPGAYQVRLTVAGKTISQPLSVSMDPRVKTSADDLQKQFDLLLKMRDRQDAMNKLILALRDLRTQLLALEKRLAPSEPAKTAAQNPLIDQSAALRKKLGAIEDQLINSSATASEDELHYPTKLNSKFGYLNDAVDSADAAPTAAELAVFAALDGQLEAQLTQWNAVTSKDLPALNEALRAANIPLVALR